jgi:hypothetical protein
MGSVLRQNNRANDSAKQKKHHNAESERQSGRHYTAFESEIKCITQQCETKGSAKCKTKRKSRRNANTQNNKLNHLNSRPTANNTKILPEIQEAPPPPPDLSPFFCPPPPPDADWYASDLLSSLTISGSCVRGGIRGNECVTRPPIPGRQSSFLLCKAEGL